MTISKRKLPDWLAAMAGVAMLSLGAGPAPAAVIFSDNFDSDPVLEGTLRIGSNWTVTAGSTDLLGPTFFGPGQCAGGGGKCLDVTGHNTTPNAFQTLSSFTFNPGFTYTLTYDLAGTSGADPDPSDGSTTAFLGTATRTDSFATAASFPTLYTTMTLTFSPSSQLIAPLRFIHTEQTPDSWGHFFDNVVLTETANNTEVPEPGTLALLGMGLMGFIATRRRRA